MDILVSTISERFVSLLVTVWMANMGMSFSPLIKYLPVDDYSLDSGRELYGQPLFGERVTIGGLLLAIGFGNVFGLFLGIKVGTVIGVLSFVGDISGSFIKRRFNISPGAYVPILDHSDYFLMNLPVFYWYGMSTGAIIIGFTVTLIVHPIVCLVGYRLGLQENPW